MAITRVVWTDDDGTGTTGTILDNAQLQLIYDSIETGWAWTSYSPAWTATGTAPAIGNGTITGKYFRVGTRITAQIKVNFGSSTTFGTGNYRFSLPLTCVASDNLLGIAMGTDAAVANYFAGTAIVTTTTLAVLVSGAATQWGQLVPFTWASGDSLVIQVTYEAA